MPSEYVPKPKTKIMPCRYCEVGIEVGWKTKKRPAHVQCSINHMCDYQKQMHSRSGPLYDAWLDSMARFVSRQIPTRGEPINNIHPSRDDMQSP